MNADFEAREYEKTLRRVRAQASGMPIVENVSDDILCDAFTIENASIKHLLHQEKIDKLRRLIQKYTPPLGTWGLTDSGYNEVLYWQGDPGTWPAENTGDEPMDEYGGRYLLEQAGLYRPELADLIDLPVDKRGNIQPYYQVILEPEKT